MRTRRAQRIRVIFAAGWVGALGLALRLGATAPGVNPEQLLALLLAAYLGAWGLVFFLARRRPEALAARFVAGTGSALLGLTLIEAPVVFGLVDYRVVFATPTPPWRRPGYRADPELIYARLGDRHQRWSCRGGDLHRLRGAASPTVYRCDLRLDADGFRNPPGLVSADVVVVGDSFVEGVHVAEPELITARLAEATGRTVVNLGRSGYGPQQELAVLRRFGLGRRPKACVWAFYEGNDLQDLNAYDSYQKDLRWILGSRRSESWYGRSFLRNAAAFAIRTWFRPEPQRPARRHVGRFLARSGVPVPIYFGAGVQHGEGGPSPPREGAPELGRLRSVLAEARALCARQGAELVVVFVPSKFRVYRDLCAFEADSACRSWPVDDLPGAVEALVADLPGGPGYLDLTPRLRAAAARGALLYLPDDPHWTAEGHRVAARALADYLEVEAGSRRGPSS